MSRLLYRAVLFVFAVFFLGACAPHVPIEYVVDRMDDAEVSACTAAANDCTLRGALTAANAASGLDIIRFAQGGTITLGATLPAINDDVTIDGTVADGNVTLDGKHAAQVLAVNGNKTLNLNAVTIANGKGNAFGSGGIANGGTLNVSHSTFLKNTAIEGGAIYNSGTANVDSTLFSENTAARGGAIYNGRTLNVTNSTFETNSGSYGSNGGGGAIENFRKATATITNSTFVRNGAAEGGAISNEQSGNVVVTNSTFMGNIANPDSGALFSLSCCDGGGNAQGGMLTLYNSIMIENRAGGDCVDPNVWQGTALSADAFNLDGDGTCDGATRKSIGQIGLGKLAANGGPTQTMAPKKGSAAIDVGDDARCSNAVGGQTFGAGGKDQRGTARPQGAHCDVGAVEVE